MRILHVSTIIEWRGGDSQMLTTYNILKDYQDIDQYILCPTGSILELKCLDQKIPHYTASRNSKFSIAFIRRLISVVKKEQIDILHVHDSNAFSLSLLALKLIPKVKFVYSRKRNNAIKKNYFKNLKYNNKRIEKIVCVSKAVKEVLLPVVKNPDKIEVIYDGIDIKKYNPKESRQLLKADYNIPEKTKVIGNVAGLTRQKDLFTFLKAAKEIRNKYKGELVFLIVGQGPLEEELKNYAKELKIDQEVIFTGFRNDVPQLLPEFDIFLISSETEGLPLSVMEAFACKVPVVATAAGGTGEAVISEVTGMISPVKNAEKLAANVLKILQNSELKEKLIENAYEMVHKKFTLEVMQKAYYSFYKSLS